MRDLSKTFKALADSNRLRIIKLLEVKPLCVCEIRSVLKLATSTVSRHLSILRDAGFIIDEKDGRWVNYRLNASGDSTYVDILLPLLKDWLPDDKTVVADRRKVLDADRNKICGL